MIKTVEELTKKVDTTSYLKIPLNEWRPILAKECQVYVFGESYLAKRFDQINFKFCGKNEAKDILIDNLYALLRYKYFPSSSEEIDLRINDIVKSFVQNLKTTLIKVSFDLDADASIVKLIPDYCVAFRNGVFNFKDNKWLFKYDVIDLPNINNKLYLYDSSYILLWYMNYEFEPLNVDIMSMSLEKFIDYMKKSLKDGHNYCFELMWNMCHNYDDIFSIKMFKHLCQILGYTILQSFSQNFVLFIGSGQNGKNSLFDGCFTGRVVPRPASNDLESIETDRFITGSLENKAHNIFLESSAKMYTESKMIKAITGSMYQTIEQKGIDKYSGLINCKFIFAANDQDRIKFSDTTQGFRRRINLFEIFYKWDSFGIYLKRGDYFNTKFNDNLDEIKSNLINTTTFIYFGIYGIMDATNKFTKNFEFSYNDWKLKYTDINVDFRDRLESIGLGIVVRYIKASTSNYDECKPLFFDIGKNRLYTSPLLAELGYNNYDEMIKLLEDKEASVAFFADNDVYINVRILQKIVGDLQPPVTFTQTLKKTFSVNILPSLYNNQPYVKCTFVGNKLKIRR